MSADNNAALTILFVVTIRTEVIVVLNEHTVALLVIPAMDCGKENVVQDVLLGCRAKDHQRCLYQYLAGGVW